MTGERDGIAPRVFSMRAAFDAAFAEESREVAGDHEDFLTVRARGERLAIRLREVASLHADLRVTPLPSEDPRVVGVAAIRSRVVAVFDLGALLGAAAAGAAPARLRWAALVRDRDSAVAFETLEGHVRQPAGSAADEIVELEGARIPVLALSRLLTTGRGDT